VEEKTFQTREFGEVTIRETTYMMNNRKCIMLVSEMGPIATLTTNIIPGSDLEEDELCIKTWSDNEELAVDALESGLFIDTKKRIAAGHAFAEVWKYAPSQG